MNRIVVGSLLLLLASLTNCTIEDLKESSAGGAAGSGGSGNDAAAGDGGKDAHGGSVSTIPGGGAESTAGTSLGGKGGSGGVSGTGGSVVDEPGGEGGGGTAPVVGGAGGEAGAPNEPQPSCVGLPTTCGADGKDSCCAASVVLGGNFNRSGDAAAPATVSSFVLDNYEVTVGRFRKFVAKYSKDMIPAGAGKNPNNASDKGWDPAWNAKLPPDTSALRTAFDCEVTKQYNNWSGGNDNRPMNCIDWYLANAFCSWDGGRLPTEAEWNYAATGGAQQRKYPWGGDEPGANASLAAYSCYFGGNGSCTSVVNFAPVGAIPANKARWGQFDMAGNVWEWVRDGYDAYGKPCYDCAQLGATADRVYRGGGFVDNVASLNTAYRGHYPSHFSNNIGVRCARALE
jgi:formylglycine-generating enzyme required for sulfatase activity